MEDPWRDWRAGAALATAGWTLCVPSLTRSRESEFAVSMESSVRMFFPDELCQPGRARGWRIGELYISSVLSLATDRDKKTNLGTKVPPVWASCPVFRTTQHAMDAR